MIGWMLESVNKKKIMIPVQKEGLTFELLFSYLCFACKHKVDNWIMRRKRLVYGYLGDI